MSTDLRAAALRRILIAAALCLFVTTNCPAEPVRIAIVPFDNLTDQASGDECAELVFHYAVTELSRFGGIELFERQRADLILRERFMASADPGRFRTYPPVDLVIFGSIRMDETAGRAIIHATVEDIRAESSSVSVEVIAPLASWSNEDLDSTARSIFRDRIGGLYRWPLGETGSRGTYAGRKIAMTAFNNYGGDENFDPLQKGIIYLAAENLARVQGVSVIEREELVKVLDEKRMGSFSHDFEPFELLSADLVVTGCMSATPRTFRLDARIIDVRTSEIVASFYSEAARNDILPVITDVMEMIARELSRDSRSAATDKFDTDRTERVVSFPSSQEALLHYARGAQFYDRGDYLASIESIERALTVDPDFTFGRWEAGRIYEKYLGRHEKAAEAYRMVLADDPDSALREKTLMRLGMLCYRRLGRPGDAAVFLSRLLRDFPETIYGDLAGYALGHSLQQTGEYRLAVAAYEKALAYAAYSPLKGSLLIRRGQCLLELEEFEKARQSFETAISGHGSEIFQASTEQGQTTIREEASRWKILMQAP